MTPVGATVEILKQVDERLLFKNTSPEALAEGIEAYLKSPKIFQEMRSSSVRKAGSLKLLNSRTIFALISPPITRSLRNWMQ